MKKTKNLPIQAFSPRCLRMVFRHAWTLYEAELTEGSKTVLHKINHICKQTIILLLFFPVIAIAQKKHPAPFARPTKAEQIAEAKHNQCLHRDIYDAAQRRAFFPFSNAATVKLISFKFEMPKDTPVTYPYTPLVPNRFKLNKHKVLEMAQLSVAGIDSLTDLMYNVGYTPVKGLPAVLSFSEMQCYSPRNAILFFDAEGNLKQYIELCFSCKHYRLSSSKIKNTVYCDQKYDMLKNFFLARGIRYVEEPH